MSVLAGAVIFALGVATGRLLRRATDWWKESGKSDQDAE